MERSREEIDLTVETFQTLVPQTAQRFFRTHKNDQDLLQSGYIGLWEAATKWNPDKGKFEPFARHCIRNNMLDYLRNANSMKNQTVDKSPPEEAKDYEDENIENMDAQNHDLQRRINEAWPQNSRERYVLIALSNGQSKLQIAVSLGIQQQTVQKIARRAYEGIKKEDG